MANINRVVLVGNLTKDPELRHTPSGTAVCSLRLAVNSRQKDASTGEWVEKPNYFDITVWDKQGENCAQYLSKGRPVAVDGRLDWREWDAQDGTKRQAVQVIASTVQFLGSRGDAEGGGGQPQFVPAGATGRCRHGLERRRKRRRHPLLDGPRPRAQGATGRPQARADGCAGSPPALLLLQGEGRGSGLEELQPAPPPCLGEGQDPLPPDHRYVPAPPAAGRRRRQARTRDGAAAVRDQLSR